MGVLSDTLHVDVLDRVEQLEPLRSEWLQLEQDTHTDLPFHTWEWMVAWWRTLHEDSPGVRDYLRVCVVRDASGSVVAIAPFVLTERPAVGPFRVRYLHVVGADPNITELRTVLCRPEQEHSALDQLRAHFAALGNEWDWVGWDASAGAAGAQVAGQRSSFFLDLGSDWQAMRRQLPRNLKESLRKCYNSLLREGLSASLEVLTEPASVERGLDDFLRLHAERARMAHGPIHADVFTSQAARAFLFEVCRALAARDIVRLFRLRVDGKIVAARLGFQMGSSLYLYYSGWDPAYARYSVMTRLLAEVIQDSIARGLATINLSTGSDVSKTRWRPREIVYSSWIDVSATTAARTRYRWFTAARQLTTARMARRVVPRWLSRRTETQREGRCGCVPLCPPGERQD